MAIFEGQRGQGPETAPVIFTPGEEVELAARGPRREMGLRQLISVFWRQKMMIIGVIVIGTAISILLVNRMTPVYQAEARIVLETARTNITAGAVENVVQGLTPDFYTHETEAEIIMSRAIASKVVEKLNLIESPLYNPALQPEKKTFFSQFLTLLPESWREFLPFARSEKDEGEALAGPALTPDQQEALIRDQTADAFLDGLLVETSIRSHVLFIHYSSVDPEMAARAANAVADVYILDQLNVKYEAAERANAWLSDRVSELRLRVAATSKDLESFRREAGIIEIGGQDVFTQQLAELNSQLIAARNRSSEAEARYNQVQALLSTEAGIGSAAAVLDSPLIQRLREQEAELRRYIAELTAQLREGHPQMVLARSELEDLRGSIGIEVNKIVINLGNELEIERVREADLEVEVNRLRARINDQNQDEITLRELQAVSDTDRDLYETVLTRFKEIDVQQRDIIQPDARVISYAAVPTTPSAPRKKLIVAVGFMLSLMLGVVIAFLREQLDTGFRTLEQVEAETGLPAIGLIPKITGGGRKGVPPEEFVLEKPNSAFSESMRTLRTALLLSNVDRPPKVVMITSAVPGEGKTITALSLARAAAKSGQRALFIDCDLRRPSIHEVLGVENDRGIVQFLSRDASLEELIRLDFKSGAHFILAGPKVLNPTDMLASDQMRGLLSALSEAYDLIVLDTPPVLAVSDALVLGRMADTTLFLARWEKTRREATATGVRRLIDAGANISGVVLTQVDVRKHDRYYNRETGYYHRDYHRYYTE